MCILICCAAVGCESDQPLPPPAPQAAQRVTPELPAKKQTELGLYLTAAEAYAKWQANPDRVVILDVRTPEEYVFVGHAEMAWNVPWELVAYEHDGTGYRVVMTPNPDFVKCVQEIVTPEDTIFLMCRSGVRSAEAVNALAKQAYQNAYTITDGFEGDVVSDQSDSGFGKRAVNGWKNSGAPWTYTVDAAKMILPASDQRVVSDK